jgi:hypothetical protein
MKAHLIAMVVTVVAVVAGLYLYNKVLFKNG